MPMWVDARGEPVVAASADAVSHLDRAVDAHLGARADTRAKLATVLSTDPQCVLAHCLDGYLWMGASRREGFPTALAALARAQAAAARAPVTTREAGHMAALTAWTRGDMPGAAHQWDAILADHPRDVLALRVSQFVLSYLGESDRMRETVARVLPAWTADTAGYGFVLGCYAYGLEEAGDYAHAEEIGRRAVALDPSDIWAAHAVTHVAEMQGRLEDGMAWIAQLSDHWAPCNNFALHLRWHEALFALELGQYDRVLTLYDREVRRESTDEYLDVTNAVSLLWRLEQADVDVGARWRELAACARRHTRDHALVFADVHYLMAIAASRDVAAIDQFVDSCRQFAATNAGTEAAVMADVGLPLVYAVLAHRRGSYGDVVTALLPIRSRFRRIGGSHAQRDLFDQLLIDAAWRGGRLDVAADLLAERVSRRPHNRWGQKHYAAVLGVRGGR
ncbi:MAG TPA: tetratricopeptide repeat protein [Gemmatimonadaceae bacterium]|nr:tetratricopeptide repeat protein [Gemmatimonadaceae bacterium]